VLADVGHLYLEACCVGRYVGQCPALECLDQNVLDLSADLGLCPVRLADRQTRSEEPGVDKLLVRDLAVGAADRTCRIQEVPEDLRDVVLGLSLEVYEVDARHIALRSICSYCTIPVDGLGSCLPCAVSSGMITGLRVRNALEGKVCWGECVAKVTRHRDASRVIPVEVAITHLDKARNQLDRQEAVGYEERVIPVATGIVQLHAALVEILYEVLAAR